MVEFPSHVCQNTGLTRRAGDLISETLSSSMLVLEEDISAASLSNSKTLYIMAKHQRFRTIASGSLASVHADMMVG